MRDWRGALYFAGGFQRVDLQRHPEEVRGQSPVHEQKPDDKDHSGHSPHPFHIQDFVHSDPSHTDDVRVDHDTQSPQDYC